MQFLTKASCEACKKGAPLVTDEEVEEFSPQIPEWRIIEVDGMKRLVRRYTFKNFVQALEFKIHRNGYSRFTWKRHGQ